MGAAVCAEAPSVLISCPGCGKRVSDRAPKCPFCGLVQGPVASAGAERVAPPPRPPVPTPPQALVPPALPGLYRRGDAIGDSYRVLEVLGEGGFGIVYLVASRRGGGLHALKTVRDPRWESSRDRLLVDVRG